MKLCKDSYAGQYSNVNENSRKKLIQFFRYLIKQYSRRNKSKGKPQCANAFPRKERRRQSITTRKTNLGINFSLNICRSVFVEIFFAFLPLWTVIKTSSHDEYTDLVGKKLREKIRSTINIGDTSIRTDISVEFFFVMFSQIKCQYFPTYFFFYLLAAIIRRNKRSNKIIPHFQYI